MQVKKRSCGECTKCCEGWLTGDAYGHSFYAGKPCHFFCKGCTIYADRPVDPCQTYECEWLTNNELPGWMRPDLCQAVITKKEHQGVHYYDLVETGQTLESNVLSWFILWALNSQKNILYRIKNAPTKIGSPEFLAMKF